MKTKYQVLTTLITQIKDKGVRYALIAILGAIVAKDIYVELFVEPAQKQIEQQQLIEQTQEIERLRALLATQSIGLDYALNGDLKTATLYKYADVSTMTDIQDIKGI